MIEAKVLDNNGAVALNHNITENVKIEFKYLITKENQLFTHGFNLFNDHNIHILSSHDKDSETLVTPLKKGVHTATVELPGNFLAGRI